MTSLSMDHSQQLTDLLWHERTLVEALLYKLVCARLLLAADERRFVPVALGEIEHAVGLLQGAERSRQAMVRAVAEELGLPQGTLSLHDLARRAPAPFDTVLDEHREAFLRLTEAIEGETSTNRRLASTALGHIQTTLTAFQGQSATSNRYDAVGRPPSTGPPPGHLDRSL